MTDTEKTTHVIIIGIMFCCVTFLVGYVLGLNEPLPSHKTIKCTKEGYPDAYLHNVCAVDCGEDILYTTKMTGPARVKKVSDLENLCRITK